MRSRSTIIFMLHLFSFCLLLSTCKNKDQNGEKASSSNLPRFELFTLEGQGIDFHQFAGSVLVVDFWATWCKPCLSEIPAYNDLYKKYRKQNFQFIGITMDSGDEERIRAFAQKHGIVYPLYIGDPNAAAAFGGIEGYPKTFILDQKGNEITSILGVPPRKAEEINKIVQRLLEKQQDF